MEKSVTDIFTEQLLHHIAVQFDSRGEHLTLLGDFENFVYEFPYRGESAILRISHHSHRDDIQIMGELEWVHHLATAGVSLSRPLLSPNQKWIETFDVGTHKFFATAFTKADGKRVTEEVWGDRLFQQWGKVVGQMHRITQKFQPQDEKFRRFHWYEDNYVASALDILPESESIIRAKYVDMMDLLNRLPIGAENYGLVHTDVHAGNFHYQDNKMTVFDCDDCCYHWYMFDIAIVFYYALLSPLVKNSPEERAEFARNFAIQFWEGYRQEFDLPKWWWRHVQTFFKLRDLQLFTVLTLKWTGELTKRQKQMINSFRHRIEQDLLYVDLDYVALAEDFC
jgi:Ser/Thr protein kinase RdoA (MazF antagonist)